MRKILNKIKNLIALAKSSNPNEANSAKVMAEKLIKKYKLTDQEVQEILEEEQKDNIIFSTSNFSSWKQRLILSVGNLFSCKIVQEHNIYPQGYSKYTYFVYGKPQHSNNVKLLFNALSKHLDQLISVNCFAQDKDYQESYIEGLLEAVCSRIHQENIIIIEPIVEPIQIVNSTEDVLTDNSHIELYEDPIMSNNINVVLRRAASNIAAYLKGLKDGINIIFNSIF